MAAATAPPTTQMPFVDMIAMDGWIDVRDAAYKRFLAAGLPRPKDEAWRYSDVKAFGTPRGPVLKPAIEGLEMEDLGIPRVLLVDGHLVNRPVVNGVKLRELADADEYDVARTHMGTVRGDAFDDLNLACFPSGLLVDARTDVALHVVHAFTGAKDTIAFPRVLIHARDGVKVTIIEGSLGPGTGMACMTTELHAHAGARIDHVAMQDRAPGAVHLHNILGRQDPTSRLHQSTLSSGGEHVRHTVHAQLAGAGAHATMTGIHLAGRGQRMDAWTHVDHAVADTTSDEVWKCVLRDDARSGFTGNVLVRQDAQRVAATQQNRNLLLSRDALAESTPQLEIHADDVQCSHGSTVGQLSKEQLFALRSRGIGAQRARSMLTEAFVADAVARIPEAARALVQRRVAAWFEAPSEANA